MNSEGIQIRIGDLLHTLYKHKMLIFSLTIAGLVLGFVMSGVSYLRGDVSRNYQITASIALNSRVPSGSFASSSAYPTNSDYQLAEDMVTAAMFILSSERTLGDAIDAYKLSGITTGDIRTNLKLSQYEDTLIIEESLYWRNTDEGIAILNAINSVGTVVLQETMNVGGLNVINPPTSKRIIGGSLNAMLCIFLAAMGFVIGAGIAVLELLLSPTLLEPNDLTDNFGVDLLGEIPYTPDYFTKTETLLTRNKNYRELNDRFASIAHILRNLNNNSKNKKYQCLYVTSAARGEGKTMAVANLAMQLAETEKKVLMVDFDLENPHLGGMFLEKVRYEHSLNALYRGDIMMDEAIVSLTGYLDILPSIAERRQRAIDTAMLELIESLKDSYDYIIMDTAPAGIASATLSLNSISDAVILVARYDLATMREIRGAIDKLEKSGITLLGGIVTGVRSRLQSLHTIQLGEPNMGITSDTRPSRPDGVVSLANSDDVDMAAVNTALSEKMMIENASEKPNDGMYTDMLRHLYEQSGTGEHSEEEK